MQVRFLHGPPFISATFVSVRKERRPSQGRLFSFSAAALFFAVIFRATAIFRHPCPPLSSSHLSSEPLFSSASLSSVFCLPLHLPPPCLSPSPPSFPFPSLSSPFLSSFLSSPHLVPPLISLRSCSGLLRLTGRILLPPVDFRSASSPFHLSTFPHLLLFPVVPDWTGPVVVFSAFLGYS